MVKDRTPKNAAAGGKDAATKQKKPRTPPRVVQLYRATRQADPSITWWMIGAIALTIAVSILLFALVSPSSWWLGLLMGLPIGILVAFILLGRRAEKLMYANMEGQPGATGAALSLMRRVWTYEQTPVDLDPKTQDAVFRAYSRKGVALIGEGHSGRVRKLLDKQVKRHERILPGVPIHPIIVGNGDGEVPLPKLAKHLMRLRGGKLTRDEVDVVGKRLRSVGGLQAPVPKGMDPSKARPNRKAMRGR